MSCKDGNWKYVSTKHGSVLILLFFRCLGRIAVSVLLVAKYKEKSQHLPKLESDKYLIREDSGI